jgi:hypothetical protein
MKQPVSLPPEYARLIAAMAPSQQKLSREFPAGSIVIAPNGEEWYICGWTEDDSLLLIQEWGRREGVQQLCASHVRNGEVEIRRVQ